MSVYYMNEAAFELPALNLVDHTTTMLNAVTDDGYAHSVCMYRSPRPAGRSLADLVDENLREASIRLRSHVVIGRRAIELDGEPAIEVAAEWRGRDGKIYTRQAHLFIGETWLIVSSNAQIEDRDKSDAIMDRALQTFRLRSAVTPARTSRL